jgi:hypothetical protein
MKKIFILLLSALTFQTSMAATRSIATAPNTSATPSPTGTWLMSESTRGLSIGAVASGATSGIIEFANFRSETESVRWSLGFNLTKLNGTDAEFGIDLGLGYRIYRFVSGSLKGFTEPGIFTGKTNNDTNLGTGYYLGAMYRFGAEYFFNPNLSIGALAGVSLTFAEDFDLIELGTAQSAVFMTWYW